MAEPRRPRLKGGVDKDKPSLECRCGTAYLAAVQWWLRLLPAMVALALAIALVCLGAAPPLYA